MAKKLTERFVNMDSFLLSKGKNEWFKPVVCFMAKKLTERFVDMDRLLGFFLFCFFVKRTN